MLGLAWRPAPAEIAEADHLLADPLIGALNVALAKARAARTSAADEIVVAADTLVVAAGTILGKPATPDEARTMLRELRERPHAVLTGVALRTADDRCWGGVVSTRVWMRRYEEAEIAAYVGRGEPFDKAGGYAIQDSVFRPVERLDGCYLNVVGLPLCGVASGLESLGVRPGLVDDGEAPPAPRVPPCAYCRAGAPVVQITPA